MSYLKPIAEKTLDRTLSRTVVKRTVDDALLNFEVATKNFTDGQFLVLIGNIVAERAVSRGTGGTFMDKVCIEIESRRDKVSDFIHS